MGYKEYKKTMSDDRQDYLNEKQYNFIHSGKGQMWSQRKRSKMLKSLM